MWLGGVSQITRRGSTGMALHEMRIGSGAMAMPRERYGTTETYKKLDKLGTSFCRLMLLHSFLSTVDALGSSSTSSSSSLFR
jgi:hypothetical protein